MVKIVSGPCPETDRHQEIAVTVEKILLGGISGNKVMGYRCPYTQEHRCKTQGSDGLNCPLYQKARALYQ